MSGRDVTVREPSAAVAAPEASVTSLVQYALEKGTDVGVIERLVALQERITERNARSEFFEAMAKFAAECPPIQKTRENSQFDVSRNGVKRKARYAPLEEITRVAQPVAARHGLIWKWNTDIAGELMHVVCRVTHVAGHSEETTVSMPFESKAGSSPQQKYGSAQTYGMRYSLIAALGITAADDDTDGNAPEPDPEPVTDEELAALTDLLDEIGDRQKNEAKLLAWLGAASLADITRTDYARAIGALKAKQAAA